MIQVSFNLAKADAMAFALYYHASAPSIRRGLLAGQILGAVGIGTFAFVILKPQVGQVPALIGGIVGAVIFALVIPKVHRFQIRRANERIYSEPAYEKRFGKITMVFNDEGISSTSPIGGSNVKWNAVASAVLTPTHLFIQLGGPLAYTIPRAQLPEATVLEIKNLAEARIAGR